MMVLKRRNRPENASAKYDADQILIRTPALTSDTDITVEKEKTMLQMHGRFFY